MSVGISRYTGPGFPLVAWRKAVATKSGIRRVSCTWWDHLVIDCIRATPSNSWRLLISRSRTAEFPPMTIMGLLAWKALATAVMVPVTPGPAVTIATPACR